MAWDKESGPPSSSNIEQLQQLGLVQRRRSQLLLLLFLKTHIAFSYCLSHRAAPTSQLLCLRIAESNHVGTVAVQQRLCVVEVGKKLRGSVVLPKDGVRQLLHPALGFGVAAWWHIL